jgi:hypothetical protein
MDRHSRQNKDNKKDLGGFHFAPPIECFITPNGEKDFPVESDAIRQMLRAVGVDFVQGYGIVGPRPLSEW